MEKLFSFLMMLACPVPLYTKREDHSGVSSTS